MFMMMMTMLLHSGTRYIIWRSLGSARQLIPVKNAKDWTVRHRTLWSKQQFIGAVEMWFWSIDLSLSVMYWIMLKVFMCSKIEARANDAILANGVQRHRNIQHGIGNLFSSSRHFKLAYLPLIWWPGYWISWICYIQIVGFKPKPEFLYFFAFSSEV